MPLFQVMPGYSQVPSQQTQSGVLYAAGAQLGATFTTPIVVGTGSDTDSDTLLVAGYSTFMILLSVGALVPVNTLAVSWIHQDPTTAALLIVKPIVAAQSFAVFADILLTFGAYGVSTATFAGDVFHTGKFRLRATTGAITLTGFRFWGSAR